MATKKVLLSGDILGKFDSLFKRVSAVNKSNGPFDLLLCTGSLMPKEGSPPEAKDRALKELEEYTSGRKAVPVPTHFVGASGLGVDSALLALADPESKANIHYLGTAGLAVVQQLSIAFLDGATAEDIRSVETAASKAEGDIDFLLTVDWPAKVEALCPPGSVPEAVKNTGSTEVANLAVRVRPRYHVAAGRGVFFARVPYINKDLGVGSHVTRFIGLGEVGNASKQKSLHALGLQPAAYMDIEALQQKPAGSTPCPYVAAQKRSLEDNLQDQDWRWQEGNKRQKMAKPSLGRPDVVKDDRKSIYVKNIPFVAEEEDLVEFFSPCGEVADVRRGMTDGKLNGWGFVQFDSIEAAERACQLMDVNLKGRDLFINPAGNRPDAQPSGEPVQGCWFCLSSESADTSLVASIGEETYIAMDKGPINEQHVLILPIEHRSNLLSLSPGAFSEVERYLSALRSCYASKGMEAVAFERSMTFKSKGGNHLQFNVLPIPAGAARDAAQVYHATAKRFGIKLKEVPGATKGEAGRAALREAVGTGEYFLVVLPDGSRLVHTISASQRHPIPFGREAAAQLAGVPERADWKVCQGDKKKEEKLTSQFKELFQPYDIMS